MRLHTLGKKLTVAMLRVCTIQRTVKGIEVLDQKGTVVLDIPYDAVKYLTDKLTNVAIGYMLPGEVIPENVFLTTLRKIAHLKASPTYHAEVEIRLAVTEYPNGVKPRTGGFKANTKVRVPLPGPGKANIVVSKDADSASDGPVEVSLSSFPNLSLKHLK